MPQVHGLPAATHLPRRCRTVRRCPELHRFPFGALAAQPEEVATDLVPKMLAMTINGGIVKFLTTDK